MKVLLVGPLAPLTDGIAQHNSNFVTNLSKVRGVQVSCLHNQREVDRVRGVEYYKLNILSLRKLMSEHSVVHFQLGASYRCDFVNFCFSLVPKNVKVVTTIHDFSTFHLSKIYRVLREDPLRLPYSCVPLTVGSILKRSDLVVVYSNYLKKHLTSKHPNMGGKIKVIFHGASVVNRVPVQPRTPPLRVCSFGSISPRKGFEEVVVAMNRLNEEGLAVTYDLYGYLPFSFYLKRLQNLTSGSMAFKGDIPSEKIISTLKNYNLLIVPRRYSLEGASGSLSYALASGVPVLTVNDASFKEYVQAGITGLLVQHSADDYYNTLKAVARGKYNLSNIARAANHWCKKNIAWSVVCKEYVMHYEK